MIETAIETERLLLRRPTEADVESPPSWLSDPEVMDWLGGIEAPAEVVRLWLDQWERCPTGKFLVERRSDGAVVGRVGANYYDDADLAAVGRRRARARLGARPRALGPWLRDRGCAGGARMAAGAARHLADHGRESPLAGVAERLGATPGETIELPGYGPHVVWDHPR